MAFELVDGLKLAIGMTEDKPDLRALLVDALLEITRARERERERDAFGVGPHRAEKGQPVEISIRQDDDKGV